MGSAVAESQSMSPPPLFDMDAAFSEIARRVESTLGKCRKYVVIERSPKTRRRILNGYGSMLALLQAHYYYESHGGGPKAKQDAAIIQSAVGLDVPQESKRERGETDATIIQSAVALDGPQERKRKREETDATIIQSVVGLDVPQESKREREETDATIIQSAVGLDVPQEGKKKTEEIDATKIQSAEGLDVPQESKRKREDTDADLTQIDQRVKHILGDWKGRLSPSRFGPTVDEYGTFLDVNVRTPSPLHAHEPAVPVVPVRMTGGQSEKALLAETKLKEANKLKKAAAHLKEQGDEVYLQIYFDAALQSLYGAYLLEKCRAENSQKDETIRSLHVYTETARLFRYCALTSEKKGKMEVAALAYKCISAAHSRSVLYLCNRKNDRQSFESDHPELPQLLNSVEHSKAARDAFEAMRSAFRQLVSKRGKSDGLKSVKAALDSSFHDIECLLRLIRQALRVIQI